MSAFKFQANWSKTRQLWSFIFFSYWYNTRACFVLPEPKVLASLLDPFHRENTARSDKNHVTWNTENDETNVGHFS